MMVEASYGHGDCVLLLGFIAVRNHEDAVDLVLAEPGLHHDLCRTNLMSRRCVGGTVSRCRPVQEPCESAGQDQSETCGSNPDGFVRSALDQSPNGGLGSSPSSRFYVLPQQ